jgi:hypothetical protein
MIRRCLLVLTIAALAGPAFAQPPALGALVASPDPAVQAPAPADGQAEDNGGRRGFGGRRGRFRDGGDGGFPDGGFQRRRGRFRADGPADGLVPEIALIEPSPPSKPIGPPPAPADSGLMRDFQGSVSAVFNPGSKAARVKLIETDSHGVEGLRYLKPGQVYRNGWRLGPVSAREAVLRRGKQVLHVDITQGWTVRPAPIQQIALAQPLPAAPGRGPGPPIPAPSFRRPGGPGFNAPTRTPAAPATNGGLGLSNARTAGPPQTVQPPPF